MRSFYSACTMWVMLTIAAAAPAAEYKIKPPTAEQAKEYKLDTKFYKKCHRRPISER